MSQRRPRVGCLTQRDMSYWGVESNSPFFSRIQFLGSSRLSSNIFAFECHHLSVYWLLWMHHRVQIFQDSTTITDLEMGGRSSVNQIYRLSNQRLLHKITIEFLWHLCKTVFFPGYECFSTWLIFSLLNKSFPGMFELKVISDSDNISFTFPLYFFSIFAEQQCQSQVCIGDNLRYVKNVDGVSLTCFTFLEYFSSIFAEQKCPLQVWIGGNLRTKDKLKTWRVSQGPILFYTMWQKSSDFLNIFNRVG